MMHSAMKRDREYFKCEVFELAGGDSVVPPSVIKLMRSNISRFYSSYKIENPALVHFSNVKEHIDEVEAGTIFALLILSGSGKLTVNCKECGEIHELNFKEKSFFYIKPIEATFC